MIELTKSYAFRIKISYFLLKIIYGIIALAAGLDKFLHVLSPSSESFISHLITNHIPLSATTILYLVGILEIIIGLLILTKYTKIGAYLFMIWYIIIILDLATLTGFYMLMLSNAGHAVANFVLAQLSAIKNIAHKL